jgi:hypothetical protein
MQWAPVALSQNVKWPRHKSDYAPPSGAEVRNEWSYTSEIIIVDYVKTSDQNWMTLVEQ